MAPPVINVGIRSPQQIALQNTIGSGLISGAQQARPRTMFGALAPIVQTGIGALLMNRANQQQQARTQAGQQALASLFGGGTQAPGAAPAFAGTGQVVSGPTGSRPAPGAMQTASAGGIQVAPGGGGPGGGGGAGALGALAVRQQPSLQALLQFQQQFPGMANLVAPAIAASMTPQRPTVLGPNQVAFGPQGQVIARGPTGTAAAQSPLGKLISDRDAAAKRFGANSPQVKAFNAAILQQQKGAPPEIKLSDISGLRKEFQTQSRGFKESRDSLRRLEASPDTGAGDIGLIYQFVRLQSPGIVSDREADMIASTGGAGQRIQALWQRWNSGERLTSGQRNDLKAAARAQFLPMAQDQLLLESEFGRQATEAGIEPSRVIIDFLGDDLRSELTKGEEATEAGQPTQVLTFDAQGNLVE